LKLNLSHLNFKEKQLKAERSNKGKIPNELEKSVSSIDLRELNDSGHRSKSTRRGLYDGNLIEKAKNSVKLK